MGQDYRNRNDRSRKRPTSNARPPRAAGPEIREVLTVEKMVPGGLGLARLNGQVIFIANVLPGEVVEAAIASSKSGYCNARVVSTQTASPERVNPKCAVYGQCGGCDLQHANHAAQLEYKLALFKDALRRQGGVRDDEWTTTETPALSIESFSGQPWAYRNRMQFHPVSGAGVGQSAIGLMARESHRVIPLNDCPVASPEIRAWLATLPRPQFPTRVPRDQPDDELNAPEPDAPRSPRLAVWGAHGLLESSGGDVTITIAGKSLSFSAASFFQSNLDGLTQLITWLGKRLNPSHANACALDLYCGCGVFASFLPVGFTDVHAVDISPENCAHARANTDPARTTVFEGDVDDWLVRTEITSIDLAIVDPPRTGLSKKLTAFLLETRPRTIAYVSCNPVTFSRDLKELRAGGYRIRDLALFDFYPQTWHMETACILDIQEPLP